MIVFLVIVLALIGAFSARAAARRPLQHALQRPFVRHGLFLGSMMGGHHHHHRGPPPRRRPGRARPGLPRSCGGFEAQLWRRRKLPRRRWRFRRLRGGGGGGFRGGGAGRGH